MSGISDMIFFDIETVPGKASFSELSEVFKELWVLKHNQLRLGEEISPEESYADRAGIFAEFGKIICISAGILLEQDDDSMGMRIKSFYGDNEKEILIEFDEMLKSRESRKKSICGHNIKEFDVPYVCRRMLIHGIKLPSLLALSGKKPWEVNHIDTMQLWKFGDHKSFTSLKLLTAVFDIPTPKDEIEGCDVAKVYWKDQDLDKIVEYCQKDVLAVGRLWSKFHCLDLVEENKVVYV